MTPSKTIIIGLMAGLAVCGLLIAYVCRREPLKALNIAVLTIGFTLLAYGHLQWATRRESPEVKEAKYIRPVIAGWALFGMGFICLQCGRPRTKGDAS